MTIDSIGCLTFLRVSSLFLQGPKSLTVTSVWLRRHGREDASVIAPQFRVISTASRKLFVLSTRIEGPKNRKMTWTSLNTAASFFCRDRGRLERRPDGIKQRQEHRECKLKQRIIARRAS
ncbi:hypothetical protein PUN28_017415 [Cardiocondyla obscurior]|uniref:Uncharacterized protein n=1 Tax=Cardiocondyla obscurior TaxID=286306 RepID=A0AAW2ERJ2_9HYME